MPAPVLVPVTPARARRAPGVALGGHRPTRPVAARGVGDLGQATVVVAGVVGVALLVLVGLVRLGDAAVDRARARTAADAAALAGVAEEGSGAGVGRTAAEDVARRNGADLERYDVVGAGVEVQVRVGDARASARAELAPPTGGADGPRASGRAG